MPNTKQAKKRMRQNEERRIANKSKLTSMRSAVKKVLRAETQEDAQTLLPAAMKRVDKAAKHNIIHANAAARVKSRLARIVTAK